MGVHVINRRVMVSTVLVALSAAACSNKPAQTSGGTAQAQPAAQTAAPVAQPPAPPVTTASVTGPVVETMNAGSYTYVRVKTGTVDIWAATAQFKVAVGDRVVVPLDMPMPNFESKVLKRTFPLIYFATFITKEGEPVPALMTGPSGASAVPPMMGAPAAAQPVGKIDPAPGGVTVADVWAKRKALGGKAVTVRGKVVKFNGGILGRNWVHIQDGSGVAKDGTHDLTVTSDGTAKVGDIVTVSGKVAIDKDFGAGYAYPVIIEGATIVVK